MTVPAELRVRHHVQNVSVRRVDTVGTVYRNTVIETSPSVSPFWKDNPPCNHGQTRRGDP